MVMTRRRFLRSSGLAVGALPLAGSYSYHNLTNQPHRISTGHTFHNWSHTIRFTPRRYHEPETEEQLIRITREASEAKTRLRTQGAGHSFSQLLVTPDALISLDKLRRPLVVDGNRVTVAAGMRLKHLIRALKQKGLALKNLGSITEQSVAGAFSTGTHGSGLRLGAISTQVVGVRLVDGVGVVRTIDENDHPALAAARINLGALGIITEVTLDCVRHYQLEYTAYAARFDEVVERLDALNAENERVVVWWPALRRGVSRDKVILITKNPVGHPGVAAMERIQDSRVLRKRLTKETAQLQEIASDSPVRGLKTIRHVIDDYDQVLTLPLLPVFHRECEYAVPVEHGAQALKAFRRIIEEGDLALDLPVEVRFVAQDDILLSPANGRNVCYIGASTLLNSTEVFERFEPLMKEFGGRSHWGKNFTLTQAEVARMWPGTYDAFNAIRQQYDPTGVFRNSLLEDLFP